MTLCSCCQISSIPEQFSHTQRPVPLCEKCVKHWGDEDKRVIVHHQMMTEYRDGHALMLERIDARREAAENALKAAQSEVEQLTAVIASKYAELPVGGVQGLIEQKVIADAQRKATHAEKARNRAMGAVFRIAELHHASGGKCSCGKAESECAELSALDFIRSEYDRWENQQIERARAGQPHGLPLDHPEGQKFTGRSVDWKGLRSTRPDSSPWTRRE